MPASFLGVRRGQSPALPRGRGDGRARGTGVGCFFDDEMHELFGIDDDERRQTLYHFTIGGPVDDARLSTLPP